MHMQELNGELNLINYKRTHDKHGVHGWPQSYWQTYIEHIFPIVHMVILEKLIT
jgi:hypothetical protein